MKKESTHEETEISILNAIDILLDNKLAISTITLMCFAIALIYSTLSTPTYQSNTLIQVEQNSNIATNPLGELGALFDIQSPAAAEIEILRSRMVLGQTVDQLNLHIFAKPNYIPIIGKWLANKNTSLSNPEIFGLKGYVSGSESIEVKKLLLPKKIEKEKLLLTKTEAGYTLQEPNGKIIAQGEIGKTSTINFEGETGEIEIGQLEAKEGAEFIIIGTPKGEAVRKLQENLAINEKGKQSGIINLSLEGSDQELTEKTLAAIGNIYVEQNTKRKAAEAEKTLIFLDSFLPELRQQMEESEGLYTEFRNKNNTFDLSSEGKAALEATVNLRVKLIELQQRKRELLPQFTQEHPSIKTINQQIKDLENEINKIEKNTKKMPTVEQHLLNLTRNVKVNSELYINLMNSAQQLRLIKEGKVGNVRIIDEAYSLHDPIKPKKFVLLLASIVIGLGLGVVYAILRGKLSTTIETPEEIEEATGISVIATIPHSKPQKNYHENARNKAIGTHVLATKDPTDPAIEAIRSLRTSLQFLLLEAKNNIILITGPTPGIGKSFLSVNFAAVIASTQKKVILLDTDLRKGYLNQYFGLDRANGLSELIAGKNDLEASLHKQVLPGLDIITTGSLPPNPSEILLTRKFKNLLTELSGIYDYVILDGAPLLLVSDSLSLAQDAGSTLLVSRAKHNNIYEIIESRKRLDAAGVRISGVILNDLEFGKKRYSNKYGAYKYINYSYASEEKI